MKNYTNKDDFHAYKAGLEKKIDELEKSIDLTPGGLINEINPFKKSHAQSNTSTGLLSKNSPLLGFASKTILTRLLGRRFSPLASTLIPIASTGTSKLIDYIERESFLERILDKVIEYTTLTPEEEQLLLAAKIEDEIVELNDQIEEIASPSH